MRVGKNFAVCLVFAGLGGLGFAQESSLVFRPEIKIGPISVGGLTPTEAKTQVRLYWEGARTELFTFTSPHLKKQPEPRTWTSWGLAVDDTGSVETLPAETLTDGTQTQELTQTQFPILYKFDGSKLNSLEKFVAANADVESSNTTGVKVVNGKLVVQGSQRTYQLDRVETEAVLRKCLAAAENSGVLPIKARGQVMPGDGLPLTEISSFTTHFPRGQKDRNNNISVASGKIDNTILMPGEVFSFNGTVGQRTIEAGFREAGVYVNGRHDRGVGGGICQVSTTLYNAALMADLQIVQRQNHSMPVAYVPVGRDATVSYGSLDLKLRNNFSTPIAIRRTLTNGTLKFAIFGIPHGRKVVILSGKRKSWDAGEKRVIDRSLRPGRSVVVERGCDGHSVSTYRKVYEGGKLIRTDNLGLSYYSGGPRIIAYNPAARRRKVTPKAAPSSPVVKPGVVAPTPKPQGPIVPQRRGG